MIAADVISRVLIGCLPLPCTCLNTVAERVPRTTVASVLDRVILMRPCGSSTVVVPCSALPGASFTSVTVMSMSRLGGSSAKESYTETVTRYCYSFLAGVTIAVRGSILKVQSRHRP